MARLGKTALKVGQMGLYGGAFLGAYLYAAFPNVRQEWQQTFFAYTRLCRISARALSMAVDYSFGVTPEKHEKHAKKLLTVLQQNGGCYVKFGQVIGQLDLLVPDEYCDAMKPLLQDARVSPWTEVERTLEEDLKKPWGSLFAEIEKEPIASASLAQVHRAKLATGETVAVKVQHRWIREQYPGDLRILEFLAKTGKKLFPEFDYLWLIDDLKKSMVMELNFSEEATNADECKRMFKGNPNLSVPGVFWGLSSERVLTMEFEVGTCITDTAKLKAQGINLREVAEILARTFSEMVFVHGFVHCDPHPGNILVRPVNTWMGVRPVVVLLDHGLYRRLPESVKRSYSNMWRALLTRDETGMKHSAAELGVTSLYPLLAGMMVGRTWEDIMSDTGDFERLRNPRSSSKDRIVIRNHARKWQKEINQILGRMHNEVVLLFKTFEWLRAIDAKLGAPLNTVRVVADYSTRGRGVLERWWLLVKFWLVSWVYFFKGNTAVD